MKVLRKLIKLSLNLIKPMNHQMEETEIKMERIVVVLCEKLNHKLPPLPTLK